MTPLRALAYGIPCGWLLFAVLAVIFFQLEDTTVGFDAPHLTGRLTLTK